MPPHLTCDFLENALDLAKRGWLVHPLFAVRHGACECAQGSRCASPGKHPRLLSWEQKASRDPEVICAWARRWPHANIGLACGPSALVVLDVDTLPFGNTALWDLTDEHGPLPNTVEVKTGSCGRHLYFQAPRPRTGEPLHRVRNACGLAGYRGLDIRAEGGYVVAPGSVHACGNEYAWESCSHPDDVPLAALPDWLLRLISTPQPPERERTAGQPIGEGRRNSALFSMAAGLRRAGFSEAAIAAALQVANTERCRPPLPAPEVLAIARSAARYAPQSGQRSGSGRWAAVG